MEKLTKENCLCLTCEFAHIMEGNYGDANIICTPPTHSSPVYPQHTKSFTKEQIEKDSTATFGDGPHLPNVITCNKYKKK